MTGIIKILDKNNEFNYAMKCNDVDEMIDNIMETLEENECSCKEIQNKYNSSPEDIIVECVTKCDEDLLDYYEHKYFYEYEISRYKGYDIKESRFVVELLEKLEKTRSENKELKKENKVLKYYIGLIDTFANHFINHFAIIRKSISKDTLEI